MSLRINIEFTGPDQYIHTLSVMRTHDRWARVASSTVENFALGDSPQWTIWITPAIHLWMWAWPP